MRQFSLFCFFIAFHFMLGAQAISELKFEKTETVDSSGQSFFKGQVLKLISETAVCEGDSNLDIRVEQFKLLEEILPSKTVSAVILKIVGDTVWRFSESAGKINTQYNKINLVTGEISDYYTRKDRFTRSHQVPRDSLAFELTELKEERKEILGYDCYKVILTIKEIPEPNFPVSVGDSIYEMYVTEEIKLPVWAVFTCDFSLSSFFPLEIQSYETESSGIKTSYKLIDILPKY